MAAPPYTHLYIFTATRLEDVPAHVRRYVSVDGSVPGASWCLDHHVTGERINMDAMPETLDVSSHDGLCTTQADADAMASMVTVILGGKANLPPTARAVLECASHWCDHLGPHLGHSSVDNATGQGVWRAFNQALRGIKTPASGPQLGAFVLDLVQRIQTGLPWPNAPDAPDDAERATALKDQGRVTLHGQLALADLRGMERIPPQYIYALHRCPVGVTVHDHPQGRLQYTVGVNPNVADPAMDLRPALAALAAAEFAHGPPVLGKTPVAGNENWGGRAAVFGSPFNHGSRLAPLEVLVTVAAALGMKGTP